MESKIIPIYSVYFKIYAQWNKVTFALRRVLFVKLHLFINAGKLSRANTFVSVLTLVSIIHTDSSAGLNFYLPTAYTPQLTPALNTHSHNP